MEKIKLAAKLENLDIMLDFILGALKKTDPDKKLEHQIRLACEEALVNIINYAYPKEPGNLEIGVEVNYIFREFVISLVDEGIYYNPLVSPEPDLKLSTDMKKIGGLGIYIFKKIMDDISYERIIDKNKLTLKKKF